MNKIKDFVVANKKVIAIVGGVAGAAGIGIGAYALTKRKKTMVEEITHVNTTEESDVDAPAED